jgi:hypothetical protein
VLRSAQCLHDEASGGAFVCRPAQRLAECRAPEPLQSAVTAAGAPAQEQSPPPSPFTRLTGHASRGSLAGARDGSDGSDGWEEVRAAGGRPGAARAGVPAPRVPQSAARPPVTVCSPAASRAACRAAPRRLGRPLPPGQRSRAGLCMPSRLRRAPCPREQACTLPRGRPMRRARRRRPAHAPRSVGRWRPGARRAAARGAPTTAARRPAPARCRAARCARARSTGPRAPRRTAAAHRRLSPAHARL